MTIPRLAVITGSIRPERFGPTVTRWFAAQAESHQGFDVDLIDLADHDLPVELAGNDPDAPVPPPVAELGARIAKADAFVVVTPVYNRSYPAGLKTAIDWFYGEWALRPVAFVSYGGVTGGLTAAEHLRGVFTEFHAVPLRAGITLPNFWESFDHDGRPVDGEALAKAAREVLDQLAWWARVLAEARRTRPYPGLDFELVTAEKAEATA